jgi:para-aminobenzoate synthetase component 1
VREPWPFFLDRAGAQSYAGSRPRTQLVVDGNGTARRWDRGRWSVLDRDPIDAVAEFIDESAAQPCGVPPNVEDPEGLPRTVGYLAYELGRYTEGVPVAGTDPTGLPLAILSTYDRIEVWEPGSQRTFAVEFANDGSAAESPPPCPDPPLSAAPSECECLARYRNAFKRLQEAIGAGDIYQANLSRRIDLPFATAAHRAYERLRNRQPVPHGAFLDLGARQILSNSPECFLRVRGTSVATSPIKGTRARHENPDKDRALAAELMVDPKERAEHLMIVDLERNDLGRVCAVGSVQVAAYAEIVSYSTVHHLVSTVRGSLRPEVGFAEILRATFPGGSITGAPKRRAMELIAEVEPQGRGVYTGAIGSWNGPRACDLNVAIRTAVVGGSRIHYCTGGGIVADSRPDTEWEETETKARAFLETVHSERA